MIMISNVVIAIVLIVIAAAAYFINLFRGKEEDEYTDFNRYFTNCIGYSSNIRCCSRLYFSAFVASIP